MDIKKDEPVQVAEGDASTFRPDAIFASSSRSSSITKDHHQFLSIFKQIHRDEDAWDVTTFEEFYNFIYSSNLRVNDSNVLQFLALNDKVSLYKCRFKKKCIEQVKRRSDAPEPISNALDLLELAHQNKEDSLVRFLHAHISQHLHHYSKQETRLQKLSFEYLNSLLKFSKNYILPLRVSENVLLTIVHNWITHNPEERSLDRYTQLMQDIEGANVSLNYSLLLADRQDEVAKNTVSPSKLKTLETRMAMMGLTGDDAQLCAHISFNVQNVNELRMDENVPSSSSSTISNLTWKIGVRRNSDSLSMYLECGGTDSSSEWSCYASAEFAIMSNKEGGENFVTEFKFGKFSSNDGDRRLVWFANDVLKWNDLVNPENGFIKDGGSIWLNAHVQADVPFRKAI